MKITVFWDEKPCSLKILLKFQRKILCPSLGSKRIPIHVAASTADWFLHLMGKGQKQNSFSELFPVFRAPLSQRRTVFEGTFPW
jgi:hypothetical protein